VTSSDPKKVAYVFFTTEIFSNGEKALGIIIDFYFFIVFEEPYIISKVSKINRICPLFGPKNICLHFLKIEIICNYFVTLNESCCQN